MVYQSMFQVGTMHTHVRVVLDDRLFLMMMMTTSSSSCISIDWWVVFFVQIMERCCNIMYRDGGRLRKAHTG